MLFALSREKETAKQKNDSKAQRKAQTQIREEDKYLYRYQASFTPLGPETLLTS